MKRKLRIIATAIGSCLFFTIVVPILLTTAQSNLFSAGFALAFVFFGVCLYLLMTSSFFKTPEEMEQLVAAKATQD